MKTLYVIAMLTAFRTITIHAQEGATAKKPDIVMQFGRVGYFPYMEDQGLLLDPLRDESFHELLKLNAEDQQEEARNYWRLQATKDFRKTGGGDEPLKFNVFRDSVDQSKSYINADGALRLASPQTEVLGAATHSTLYGGYEMHKALNISTNLDSRTAFALVHIQFDEDFWVYNLLENSWLSKIFDVTPANLGSELLVGPTYEWDRESGREALKLVMDWQPWKSAKKKNAETANEKDKEIAGFWDRWLTRLTTLQDTNQPDAPGLNSYFDLMLEPRIGLVQSFEQQTGDEQADLELQPNEKDLLDDLGGTASIKLTVRILNSWKWVSDWQYVAPIDDLSDRIRYEEHRLSFDINKPDSENDKSSVSRPAFDIGAGWRKGKRSPDYTELDQFEFGVGARF